VPKVPVKVEIRWKFGGNITTNWYKKQLEQTSYADVEIKERLDAFRKKKDANVAKTAMAMAAPQPEILNLASTTVSSLS